MKLAGCGADSAVGALLLLGVAFGMVSCNRADQPFDPHVYVSSTAPPRPPPGRIWLRRMGETKLWWADELRREKLVSYLSTCEVVDKAEQVGAVLIEVRSSSVVGRNERGEEVISFGTSPTNCIGTGQP